MSAAEDRWSAATRRIAQKPLKKGYNTTYRINAPLTPSALTQRRTTWSITLRYSSYGVLNWFTNVGIMAAMRIWASYGDMSPTRAPKACKNGPAVLPRPLLHYSQTTSTNTPSSSIPYGAQASAILASAMAASRLTRRSSRISRCITGTSYGNNETSERRSSMAN